MNSTQPSSFEDFLTNSAAEIYLSEFIVNLLLSGFFALLLQIIYVRFSNSITNREIFAKNFFLLSITTTLIIAIIKSSLALSLGLVGALSIIRFRAAIKEPEELSFIFLVIAMGLGFGAGQIKPTIIAFFIITPVFIISKRNVFSSNNIYSSNLLLSSNSGKLSSNDVIKVLEKHSKAIDLIRLDDFDKNTEISLNVEFSSYEDMENAKLELSDIDSNLRITFLDNKSII